jgi:hypothetical protein
LEHKDFYDGGGRIPLRIEDTSLWVYNRLKHISFLYLFKGDYVPLLYLFKGDYVPLWNTKTFMMEGVSRGDYVPLLRIEL